MRVISVLLGFYWLFCFHNVMAARFVLPKNGDTVVGYLQQARLKTVDTLPEIARRYNQGFNEIKLVNPGVDAWASEKQGAALVPSAFILPPKPWKGIIVNLAEMRLYYFPPVKKNRDAIVKTYPLAIGQDGWRTPAGVFEITEKIENPSWTIPPSVVAEEGLARYGNRRIIPGADEDNPLGVHALMLNKPGYLIHGTNKPYSIGRRVSRGCLRMYPEDIDELFSEVPRGITVRIIDQPFKVGVRRGVIYIESHKSNYLDAARDGENMTALVSSLISLAPDQRFSTPQWQRLNLIASDYRGIPVPFAKLHAESASLQQTQQQRQWQVKLGEFSTTTPFQMVEQILQYLRLPYASVSCGIEQLRCLNVGPLDSRQLANAVAEVFAAKLLKQAVITVPREP